MSTLELLQLQNEHKANTYYDEGEDFEETEKNSEEQLTKIK